MREPAREFALPDDDSDNDTWLTALKGLAAGFLIALVAAALLTRPGQEKRELLKLLDQATQEREALREELAARDLARLHAQAEQERQRKRAAQSELAAKQAPSELPVMPMPEKRPDALPKPFDQAMGLGWPGQEDREESGGGFF